jgi:hypothetical protein
VRDASGAAVAGAHVDARGPSSYSTDTAGDGSFTLTVAPGIYHINIVKAGYSNASIPDVIAAAGATTPFTVTLNQASLESLRQIGSVTVQGHGNNIYTGAAVSNYLPAQAFTNLANPQINDVLQHIPDVTIQHMGSQPDTTIIVGSVQPYETQVLIDGHPLALGQYGVWLSQYFPSYLIGGVETQSGPGNTTPFANLAVGGTANLLTPSYTYKPTAELTYGVDAYQVQYSHFLGTGSVGHLQYVLGLGTDGYNGPYYGTNRCIVTPNVGADSNVAPSEAIIQNCQSADGTFFSKGLVGKLKYNFSSVTSLEASFIGAWGGYNPQGTAWGLAQGEQKIVACLPSAPLQCTNPEFSGLIGTTINGLSWYQGSRVYNNQDLGDAQFRTSFADTTLLVRPYIGTIEPEIIVGSGEINYPIFFSPVGTPTAAFTTACENDFGSPTGPNGKPATVNGQQECFGSPYSTFEADKLYGTTFSLLHPIGEGSLNLTYDFHGQSTFAYINNPQGVSVPFSADRYSTFSLTGDLHPAPKLAINAGLYDTTWTVDGVKPRSLIDDTLIGFRRSVTRFDPHLALRYRLDGATSLRAAWGTSATFPYLGQVSGLATFEQPAQSLGPPFAAGGTLTEKNANLSPEVSLAFDVGADHRFENGSVLSLDLTDTTIHNVFEVLTTTTTNPTTGGLEGIFSPINVARLETKVITLKYNDAPLNGFGFNIAGALASAEAAGLPTSAYTPGAAGFPVNNVQICGNGVAAPGIPTCIPYLKGYGQLTYERANGLFFGLGVDYEGKNNAYFQPPFALVDFTARKPVSPNAEFQVSVENLLNTNNYGTYLSTPNAGAPIVAGTTNAAGTINEQTSFVASRISAPPRIVRLQVRFHFGR